MRAVFGASFVGRATELDDVRALVADRPLVSIVGEGGVGKTRLATELVATRAYRGPVAWAELAAARSPVGVRDAVVDALPDGVDAMRLEELLPARMPSGLLVLDNCEHVVDSVVDVVELVGRVCPDAHVLATSRERLGVPGEVTYRLGPLVFPPSGSTLDEASQSPALMLLADRVRDVLGEFRVDEANLDSLLALAQVVEGSPLGLELAAARAASIPIDELADLLPGPLRRAAGSHRGGPARHESLDASVRWSVDLLSRPGRLMVKMLSVFSDSFRLPTARSFAEGLDAASRHSVEQLIGELVDASVVRLGADGRYRLPAAVRFLAGDLLVDAGLDDVARDKHADTLRDLMVVEGERLKRDQAAWLAMLDAELPEVRTALDWHIHRGRPDQAARMLVATLDHWHIRGRHAEFTRRCEEVLAQPDLVEGKGPVATIASHEALMAGRLADSYHLASQALETRDLDDPWRARALANRAWCGFFSGMGSDNQIWADGAEARRIVRRLGDEGLVTEVDTFWAALTTHSRSIPTGTALDADVVARSAPLTRARLSGLIFQAYGTALTDLRLEHRLAIAHEALSQSRSVGHPAFEVMALTAIGTVAALRGAEQTADHHLRSAAEIASVHDLPTFANLTQRWRAFASYRFGRNDTAAEAELGVELARATSNQWDAAAGLWLLGLTRLREGDTETASRILREASEASRDPSYPFSRLRSELGLAVIDHLQDRYQDALDRVHGSLTIASELGDVLGIAASLDHLALLESTRDAHERAGRLLGAVDALHEANSVARLPFESRLADDTRDRLTQGIGDRAAGAAIESGRSLTLDQAVRLARRSRGARRRPSSGWDSLTPAEHDVVALAAAGLTTPQIAAELFVTSNTVKTHLRQVYAKLGITSRAQLAAIHTEQTSRS